MDTLARWLPTKRYTYGFRSASILAALFNGIILLVATGAIAWEALRRLTGSTDVAGVTVMVAAAAGIVVNGVSAWPITRQVDSMVVMVSPSKGEKPAKTPSATRPAYWGTSVAALWGHVS